MQKRYLLRTMLVALATAALATPAFGDIAAFNAAVKAGDYKTAAAEAKTIWSTWDKADPDTAILAREFGFASYVSGDFAGAQMFGQFLKDKGATLPTPDDQPATSRVLLSAASFRLKSDDATRKDLLDALKAREAAPGLDTTSLLASEALYKSDWAAGRFVAASDSGMLAYRIISRGGEVLAPRALEARSTAAAAGFLGGRDQQDYGQMMDTHDAIIVAIDAAKDPKRRQSLVNLSFTMEAWGNATYQFFDSAEQIGSSIPMKIKRRAFTRPQYTYFPDDPGSPAGDYCQLDINERAINYPQSSGFSGIVGSVIVKMDIDAQGGISNVEPLASVPARQFVEAVEDAAPRLKATRAGGAPGCSIARENYIMTFVFRIL
jgi:hypothetical protein